MRYLLIVVVLATAAPAALVEQVEPVTVLVEKTTADDQIAAKMSDLVTRPSKGK